MQNYIDKVAVLGAGVMGAQIAALLGNAQVRVILFDIAIDASKVIKNLKNIKPSPITWEKSLEYIQFANYEDNLELLKDCNLIIEAIAERLDWKEELYLKIVPYLDKNTIFTSNTSGLSIDILAKYLPQNKFCGVHFFNPPRYMPLVELIPTTNTDKQTLDNLEKFLVTTLGKNVVIARDTPNFIANRLGVFASLTTFIYTEKFQIPLEVVDQLTGKNLLRAKSATYRTIDIVGLDTFSHVVNTMLQAHDDFEAYYHLPKWFNQLIENKAYGQKSGMGFYKKDKDGIKVIDLATLDYGEASKAASKEVLTILKDKSWAKKLESLRNSDISEAQFLWSCFRDLFHYAAVLLGKVSDSPRDMDLAIRYGFGWKEGIFEIWQKAGFKKVATWIQEDIDNGKTIAKINLPSWVFSVEQIYQDSQYYSVNNSNMTNITYSKAYQKQLFPEKIYTEADITSIHIIYEDDGVKLWHTGDDIAILSFKSKMCAVDMDVLNGISKAIDIAEAQYNALIIWQEKDIFSVGANLEEFGFSIMMNGIDTVNTIIDTGHRIVAKKIRYSKIPVIAAVKGYTLGGGCEIMLHCDSVVAAMESYIGLVEAGVGLLPGWGGSTEMAYRASQAVDPWLDFQAKYKTLALAEVATSASHALSLGFLKPSDTIIMNKHELLFVAKAKARLLVDAGYRAPLPVKFKVFGEQGIANIRALLTNMYEGRQISTHDLLIAQSIAVVMCGGEIDKEALVSQDWLLNLEKLNFTTLALSEKTAQRIQHMLEKGKPLRN